MVSVQVWVGSALALAPGIRVRDKGGDEGEGKVKEGRGEEGKEGRRGKGKEGRREGGKKASGRAWK